jgi:hypothetical protein
MPTQWFQNIDELSPAALTVRAQAVSPTDQGRLYWSLFFPRQNVPSVNLQDVTTLDDRPTADRREWNQRGRHVPPRVPARREVNIVPIEAYDKIGEYEMQRLAENYSGNAARMNSIMGTSIPDRVTRLALADYRRLEVDAFTAWILGTITQRNPQNAAETYAASYGIAAARIQTAGTAWNDAAVNAYDEFLSWAQDALDTLGSLAGVVTRQAVVSAIQADAPDLIGGVSMTRAQLVQRLSDDLGNPLFMQVIEDTVDVYDDGGVTTTAAKVFPVSRIAAIPSDGRIGYSAFAPVTRAQEMARALPAAGIDTNGVTVYYDDAATGRELTFEAQINALPVPDEQKVFVMNTLVT